MTAEVVPVLGVPEIAAGDDLGALLAEALTPAVACGTATSSP